MEGRGRGIGIGSARQRRRRKGDGDKDNKVSRRGIESNYLTITSSSHKIKNPEILNIKSCSIMREVDMTSQVVQIIQVQLPRTARDRNCKFMSERRATNVRTIMFGDVYQQCVLRKFVA
jgi:hypothetical protein